MQKTDCGEGKNGSSKSRREAHIIPVRGDGGLTGEGAVEKQLDSGQISKGEQIGFAEKLDMNEGTSKIKVVVQVVA